MFECGKLSSSVSDVAVHKATIWWCVGISGCPRLKWQREFVAETSLSDLCVWQGHAFHLSSSVSECVLPPA